MRPRHIAAGLIAPLLLLAAACGDPDKDTAAEPDTTMAVESSSAEAQPEAAAAHDQAPAKQEKTAKPKPTKAVEPKPATRKSEGRTYLVTRIVDGDTLELGNGETVRVVGIDTPERGQCGYDRAGEHLAGLVLFKQVRLVVSDEDRDHYGRLLRYVDVKKDGRTVDAGLNQIRSGFAIARYDSRDGYGYHPREPEYIRSDKAVKQFTCAAPAPVQSGGGGGCHPGYTPCLPITADLDCADVDGPITVLGDDPYGFDADGDGTGCDS
jgi:endonuclease YncB( thermonuclease family)